MWGQEGGRQDGVQRRERLGDHVLSMPTQLFDNRTLQVGVAAADQANGRLHLNTRLLRSRLLRLPIHLSAPHLSVWRAQLRGCKLKAGNGACTVGVGAGAGRFEEWHVLR